jgi:hypothetical protein
VGTAVEHRFARRKCRLRNFFGRLAAPQREAQLRQLVLKLGAVPAGGRQRTFDHLPFQALLVEHGLELFGPPLERRATDVEFRGEVFRPLVRGADLVLRLVNCTLQERSECASMVERSCKVERVFSSSSTWLSLSLIAALISLSFFSAVSRANNASRALRSDDRASSLRVTSNCRVLTRSLSAALARACKASTCRSSLVLSAW